MTLDRELTDEVRARQREADADGPQAARPRPPLVSTLGNAAVQRLLRSEHDDEHPVVDATVEDAIESKRGGGRSLDTEVQRRVGGALGADLSDVRVHDDSEANSLNHAVSADAFTTGSDIFFRQGKYQPGTSGGDQLLAHELTHVVQQRSGEGAGGGDMRVSSPQDAAEQEASAFSKELASAPSSSVSTSVAREEAPEEELQMSSALAREELPEEELQMSSTLARELPEEEEEPELAPSLHREEVPEEDEEGIQMSLHRSPHGPSAAAGA